MKLIAVLIDDSKQISLVQIEIQIENVDLGMMLYGYSACGAPASKTAFIEELANDWLNAADSV